MDISPDVPPQATPLFPKFHGEVGNYFKIWIVNVLLTIITVGIYSAWAKVRTLKFMYGSTELAGSRFDFHGQPKAILIGRIFAVIIFALYAYSAFIHPALPVLGIILAFFSVPFLFVKSLKFRLANTSYRNLRFSFRGTIRDAGKIWFKYAGAIGICLLLNAVLVWVLQIDPKSADKSNMASYGFFVLFLFGFIVIYSWSIAHKFLNAAFEYLYSNLYFGSTKTSILTSSKEVFSQIIKPQIASYLAIFGLVIVFAFFAGIFGSLLKGNAAFGIVLGILLVVVLYIGVIAVAFYLKYSILNYVWTSAKLGESRAQTQIKFIPYATLGITNILAIGISLGLLYPWARIRMSKYLTENRGLEVADFNAFTFNAEKKTSAVGEEVVDIFDFDYDFGL